MSLKETISTQAFKLAIEWEKRVGKTSLTELCLKHGADINYGINPYFIHSVIQTNDIALLQRILDHQKLSTKSLKSALEVAVTNGHCKIAKYLLENHSLPSQDTLNITLMYAVLFREHSAAALLLQYGANKKIGSGELDEAIGWSQTDITAMEKILDTVTPDPGLINKTMPTDTKPEILIA